MLREYALLLIRMGERIMRDNEASPPGKGEEGAPARLDQESICRIIPTNALRDAA